jgi:hypothetical protein
LASSLVNPLASNLVNEDAGEPHRRRAPSVNCYILATMTSQLLVRCSALLCAAAAAFAQSGPGAISGTVLDPAGRAFAHATVQAKDAQGHASKTTSSAQGQYTLSNLAPGSYDVTVNVPGLRGFERKGVPVEAGGNFKLDIRLQEGSQLSTLGEDPLALEADAKLHAPPSGPTPRTRDGKPDFTGVWWRPIDTDIVKPEWLPNAQAVAKQRAETNRKDSPQAHCLPSAVTRAVPMFEFVQSGRFLVMIADDDSPGFHQIYLDRGHPKVPDTDLWYGDSIGRWEGDTLVVDRVNFTDRVWLDQDGHPHSGKLHVIERYRRPDAGHLEAEITVEDPEVLAKPWVFKRVSDLAAKESIREFICTENNRDVPHLVGQ